MHPQFVTQPATGQHQPAATASVATDSPDLLQYVDFKWLMVGEGHLVDLDRLKHDRAYHRGCLALAAGSRSATLRRAGERLAETGCAPGN